MKQSLKLPALTMIACAVLGIVAMPLLAAETAATETDHSLFSSQNLWQGELPTTLKQAQQDLDQWGLRYKYYPPRKSPSSWLSFTYKHWEGTLYFDEDFKANMLLLKSPEYSDKARFDKQLAAYLTQLGDPETRRKGYENPIFEEQILIWPDQNGIQYKLNLHTHLQSPRWQIWEARSLSTKNE